MLSSKKVRQLGFTLLELLVVIGIIGLLASILVVNLTSARQRARDTKRIGDVRGLQVALEDYYGKNGKYPDGSIADLVTGKQISRWPTDPLVPGTTSCTANSKDCYYYAHYPATNSYSYHLGASLEEGGSLLLQQDRDCNSTTATTNGCPQAQVYTSSFTGADTAGCTSTDTNRYCYDIAQ